MAKKAKKEVEVKDEDLLSDPIETTIYVKEEEKPKTLLGYHPITGAEVWSK